MNDFRSPWTSSRGPVTRHHPIAAVCAALGVPPKDWRLFRRWTDETLNSKALDELYAYVDVMIADRCRKPGDDLLSHLIQVEVDGYELTSDDLRVLVATLVGASALTP